MPTESGAGMDNRRIILIVGAAAVVLAVILIIAFMPREPEVDPYVVQLEGEVAMYTSQADSLLSVVDGLDSRLNTVRAEMDTARSANRKLLTSLRKVNGELRQFQRLYREQQEMNTKLVAELKTARDEKEQATEQVIQLKTSVDSLNTELYAKTTRLVRLESSLEEALSQARSMKEAVTSVLVYVGTEEELKTGGYLKAGRSMFLRKSFKSVGFPDVTDEQNRNQVMRVAIGETLVIQGKLDALADRHGELKKGDEFEESQGPPGQTLVTFIDSMMAGQRILAVVKR